MSFPSARRAICGLGCVTLLSLLAGCAAELSPASFEGRQPVMRPEVFFVGSTESRGLLQNRSGAPTHRFTVQGRGRLLPDGRLQLDQRIRFEGQPEEQRTWVMQRVDAHRYTASLTDASGPVEAEAHGDLFHLRYPMKKPFGGHMEQWLYLQPDGITVLNEATVSILGVVVARLSERITHAGP